MVQGSTILRMQQRGRQGRLGAAAERVGQHHRGRRAPARHIRAKSACRSMQSAGVRVVQQVLAGLAAGLHKMVAIVEVSVPWWTISHLTHLTLEEVQEPAAGDAEERAPDSLEPWEALPLRRPRHAYGGSGCLLWPLCSCQGGVSRLCRCWGLAGHMLSNTRRHTRATWWPGV